ncbi:MAG: DNA translocase FtsK [Defluviitaleaceae bacterium]|nr:DNA translocase FtsK [Defluviitaleaceae bacterium]
MPRKPTKAVEEKSSALQTEVKYLAMAAAGVLLLLVVFLPGEEPAFVIRMIYNLLFGFFGFGAFIFPIGILLFAVSRLVAKDLKLPIVRIISVFWLILSVLHIFIFERNEIYTMIFTDVFSAGIDSGGGVFGLLIGGMLREVTNEIIAIFVLVAGIIILLVLISGRSFVHLVGQSVEKVRDYYEESREQELKSIKQEKAHPLPPPPPRSAEPPKKGNFINIDENTSEAPTKIILVNEELDEGFYQRRERNPLFAAREDEPEVLENAPKRSALMTFPEPISETPISEPPPETTNDSTSENHPPLVSGYDDYEAPPDEPVVLPIADVGEDYGEPIVKGLVDGAEKTDKSDLLFADDNEPDSAVSYSYENFHLPSLNLLSKNERATISAESRTHVLENSRILEETLRSFRIEAKVVEVSVGPTVTRYDLAPGPGVKVSSISNLSNDLALSLAAQGLRIEAPVPGKSAVGIEIPNKEPQGVFLREILEDERFVNYPSKLAFAVGKDIAGSPIIADVARMPHLLIAGATGSGKSVCINTLIASLLFKARPDEVKLLMIDPKVVELSVYNGIPHLLIPVVTEPKKASGALSWAVAEMEKRYGMFAETGCRDLKGYNKHATDNEEPELPQIVIIIDELADLMMTCKGEVEESICRLAQKARAAGIHLIVATQRPSVDVITGLIKANIPSRLAFAVSSGTDSRTVLDMYGAEKLLGKGDMLFLPMGQNKPIRVQGGFISDAEVEKLVTFLKAQAPTEHSIEEIQKVTMPGKAVIEGEVDEFFHDAVDFLITKGKGSTSMLQRQFRIGYNRASRLMDDLQARGIVGPEDGVKPRKVTITREEYNELYERN